MTDTNPLLEQVRSGASPELELLAAQGILPLSPEELIPIQVQLAASRDALVAGYARDSLSAVEPRFATAFLASEAAPVVLRWFLLEHPDAVLVETVLRRRDVPRELLAEVAPQLSPDLQEVLLLRQDAIVEAPAILDTLETNPRLSLYSRRKILEYREHLLPRDLHLGADEEEDLLETEPGELTQEDLAEIERVRALPVQGEVDETTGLSEAQVRSLPVPVRIKLCRGASRTLRSILIKDTNRMVAMGVICNAAFTEDEVEQVASNRSMDEEVLAFIARRREWISRYGVCKALVMNSRTPVGIAVRLVSRISVKHLKLLRKDRNVSEPVRSTAERLYRIKAV